MRTRGTQGIGEVLYEFVPAGNVIKVSAIHASSGTEVSIVGSPRASKRDMKRIALAKLNYVLSKQSNKL